MKPPIDDDTEYLRNERDGSLFILVPGGEFLAGDDKVPINLADFYLAVHPVTNAQYKRFLDASGQPAPNTTAWGRTPSVAYLLLHRCVVVAKVVIPTTSASHSRKSRPPQYTMIRRSRPSAQSLDCTGAGAFWAVKARV